MTRALTVLSLAFFAAQVSSSMPASVRGDWRIVKILETPGTACWDNDRARTLLNSGLRYSAGHMRWQGGDVAVSEALTRTLTAAQFAEEYKLPLGALGIRAGSVTEIDLQHEDADITGATTEVPGDTILLAGPGRIVVSACGVFFSAVKAGGH